MCSFRYKPAKLHQNFEHSSRAKVPNSAQHRQHTHHGPLQPPLTKFSTPSLAGFTGRLQTTSVRSTSNIELQTNSILRLASAQFVATLPPQRSRQRDHKLRPRRLHVNRSNAIHLCVRSTAPPPVRAHLPPALAGFQT